MSPFLQDAFLDKHGVKLGFMSAFVKASADALQVLRLTAHVAQAFACSVSTLCSARTAASCSVACQHHEASMTWHLNVGMTSGDPLSLRLALCARQAVPAVNGVIDGTDLVYREYYDISIAVATPKGLVVPVLRNVEDLDFAGVERVRYNAGIAADTVIPSALVPTDVALPSARATLQ